MSTPPTLLRSMAVFHHFNPNYISRVTAVKTDFRYSGSVPTRQDETTCMSGVLLVKWVWNRTLACGLVEATAGAGLMPTSLSAGRWTVTELEHRACWCDDETESVVTSDSDDQCVESITLYNQPIN